MTNEDRLDAASQHGDATAVARDPAAQSLEKLISAIATQITDADLRHSELLQDLQARLAALGSEARSVRSRIPETYLPAFERIEDGMHLLAERLAAGASLSDMAPVADAGPAAHRPATGGTETGIGAAANSVDTPATADDRHQDGPWSRDDADALAAIYHSPEMGFLGTVHETEIEAPFASAPDQPHADHAERLWLEERFADIASRVEQSLAEMHPERSFQALDRRLEQFEERFSTVIEDVATRADVEGLQLIEAHITELTSHVEEAQRQLARLDGIEEQLKAVARRLADETEAAVPPQPGIEPGEIDAIVTAAVGRFADRLANERAAADGTYKTVARLAAEQAVAQLAAVQPQTASAPAVDPDVQKLRHLLEGLIRERREGDEQQAAMLDTLQQAMVRVLDRIDTIEQAQVSVPAAAARPGTVQAPVTSASAPLSAMASATPSAPGRPSAPGTPSAPASAPAFAAMPSPAVTQPASPASAVAPGSIPVSPFAHVPGAASAPQSAAPLPPAAASGPNQRLRQDFIADAQRAKLKAQGAAAAASDTVKLSPPRSAVAGKSTTATDVAGQAKASASRIAQSLPIKKLLVAALGLIILVQGANLLLARRSAETAKPQAAPAKTTAPQASEKAAPAAPAAKAAAAPMAAPPAAAAPVNGAPAPTATPAESGPKAAAPRQSGSLPATASGALAQTSGPAEGANGWSATRPAPETVTDSLNLMDGPADIGPIEQRADTVTGSVPLGITLDTSGRKPTPYDLARLRQQQDMAGLSSKLGAAAAYATPAALLPERNETAAAPEIAGQATAATSAGRALELPPATVGPLSLRLAAANGDPSAEFEVGARLAEGKGTDQSFKEAVKWYTRSASQGFAQAQYRLGTFHERGLGVAQDLGRARIWYGRAAEQGNVKAMHNLAVLDASGRSGSPDYAAAARWFAEAAKRGLSDSQYNLAVLHESGLGVGKDLTLAYQWFSLAARSGDKQAVARRDVARAALPAANVASVDEIVKAWLPQEVDQMANDARMAGEAWKRRENAEGNG